VPGPFLLLERAGSSILNFISDVILSHLEHSPVDGFEFVGYDLVEAQTGVSALTNCGGFPDVFANAELSVYGLLTDFSRARDVSVNLRSLNPEEPHANCDMWTIFRASAK
jgi:hypothetical protein